MCAWLGRFAAVRDSAASVNRRRAKPGLGLLSVFCGRVYNGPPSEFVICGTLWRFHFVKQGRVSSLLLSSNTASASFGLAAADGPSGM